MSCFLSLPHLPKSLSAKDIRESIEKNISEFRYGRQISGPTSFDMELATYVELRTVPPGWLDHHHVLVPEAIPLTRQEDILARLQRMVNTVRDKRAIDAILCGVTIPQMDDKGKTQYVHPIKDLAALAQTLTLERTTDPTFVDCLLRGYLGECAQALARRTVKIGPLTAKKLLIQVSILWGLHDLQIIACRLFQATRRPTGGFMEAEKFTPQTLAGLESLASTVEKYTAKIQRNLGQSNSNCSGAHNGNNHDLDLQKIIGYINGHRIEYNIQHIANNAGFSEDQILDKKYRLSDNNWKQIYDITGASRKCTRFVARMAKNRYFGREAKPTPPLASTLTAASYRDGLRPEVSLSYAIITFVHMVLDIPRRIDAVLENPASDALTCEKLTPHERSKLNRDVEELIEAYRAIYLWDPNHLKNDDDLRVSVLLDGKATTEDSRRILIENQSNRFVLDPRFTDGAVCRKHPNRDAGRKMYNAAWRVLENEKVLRSTGRSTRMPPDQLLAPALAWRFACTRANVPASDLTRHPSIVER